MPVAVRSISLSLRASFSTCATSTTRWTTCRCSFKVMVPMSTGQSNRTSPEHLQSLRLEDPHGVTRRCCSASSRLPAQSAARSQSRLASTAENRMREPRGSGHTAPLRTHTQTAGKINGDSNRKKSAGDQGRQQPPVFLDRRRRSCTNQQKMPQLNQTRSAPRLMRAPRQAAAPLCLAPPPHHCWLRHWSGVGGQPTSRRQEGRAPQRHHRRRPHTSSPIDRNSLSRNPTVRTGKFAK
eukprot:COSAG02_NODE_7385_length_3039_cov_5.358163_1_plen_238_part_00